MNQPIIHTFLGVPGSGKSYFARHLAERTNTVRLNSDALRLAIFGSLEAISEVYHSPYRQRVNTYVDRTTSYIVSQLLTCGQSVICDAHHVKHSDRKLLEELAKDHKALVVLIRIQTPFQVALQRGQERDAKPDQRRLTKDEMREVMERHAGLMDEPSAEENVIIIDGQQPFEQQYQSYKKQIEILLAE